MRPCADDEDIDRLVADRAGRSSVRWMRGEMPCRKVNHAAVPDV